MFSTKAKSIGSFWFFRLWRQSAASWVACVLIQQTTFIAKAFLEMTIWMIFSLTDCVLCYFADNVLCSADCCCRACWRSLTSAAAAFLNAETKLWSVQKPCLQTLLVVISLQQIGSNLPADAAGHVEGQCPLHTIKLHFHFYFMQIFGVHLNCLRIFLGDFFAGDLLLLPGTLKVTDLS